MPLRELSPVEIAVKERFIQAMYMCIGRRIVKSKKEFAERIGIAPTNLVRMESNANLSVSAHHLAMLCKLGVRAEWLLLGGGEMFS